MESNANNTKAVNLAAILEFDVMFVFKLMQYVYTNQMQYLHKNINQCKILCVKDSWNE